MSDYENEVHSINYKRDNILYVIRLYQDKNGNYYGNWYCTVCGETGGSSCTNSSENIVIAALKADASSHHGNNHLQ